MIENSSHVTLNYETRWRIVVWRHYLASKVHRPLVSSSKLQRVTSPQALLRFPWGRWRSQRFAQREWARRLQDRNWLYMRLSIYENFKKYSHNDALSFFPLAFFFALTVLCDLSITPQSDFRYSWIFDPFSRTFSQSNTLFLKRKFKSPRAKNKQCHKSSKVCANFFLQLKFLLLYENFQITFNLFIWDEILDTASVPRRLFLQSFSRALQAKLDEALRCKIKRRIPAQWVRRFVFVFFFNLI